MRILQYQSDPAKKHCHNFKRLLYTMTISVIKLTVSSPLCSLSVVESESTRSFHYSRGAALRRRETFAEAAVLSSARSGAMQRSGSFHQGSGLEAARHWCGSVDELSVLAPRGSSRTGERGGESGANRAYGDSGSTSRAVPVPVKR